MFSATIDEELVVTIKLTLLPAEARFASEYNCQQRRSSSDMSSEIIKQYAQTLFTAAEKYLIFSQWHIVNSLSTFSTFSLYLIQSSVDHFPSLWNEATKLFEASHLGMQHLCKYNWKKIENSLKRSWDEPIRWFIVISIKLLKALFRWLGIIEKHFYLLSINVNVKNLLDEFFDVFDILQHLIPLFFLSVY